MNDASRETVRFDEVRWVEPVERAEELPDQDGDGLLCYVQDEDAVYRLTTGIWVKQADISAR